MEKKLIHILDLSQAIPYSLIKRFSSTTSAASNKETWPSTKRTVLWYWRTWRNIGKTLKAVMGYLDGSTTFCWTRRYVVVEIAVISWIYELNILKRATLQHLRKFQIRSAIGIAGIDSVTMSYWSKLTTWRVQLIMCVMTFKMRSISSA